MIKDNTRYCDRCGSEIPSKKTKKDNVHDIIKLGFVVNDCECINWRKDICSSCADLFDAFWNEGESTTKKSRSSK